MKTCKECGIEFSKPRKTSPSDWAKRRFCTKPCVGAYRRREGQEHLHIEVAWIMDHDNPESVARRVGYRSAADLVSRLRVTGAVELADKLARNVERYRKGEIGYRDELFA